MAYKNLIGSGKHPFVVLNLEVPPSEIDVNVHPTKKEVRYKNTNQIFNFIYSAVISALNVSESYGHASEMLNDFWVKKEHKSGQEDDVYVADEKLLQQSLLMEQETQTREHHIQASYPFSPSNGLLADSSPMDACFSPDENIIGQYKNTYILIEREEGLEIVDQHIAEERFIYEKLKGQKQAASQLLFVSDVLEVAPSEAEFLKEHNEKFEKFGYGIEFLKGNQLIFKKVPQLLSKTPPKELLANILENLSGDLDNLEEKILITIACKASVKAGQRLNVWQMQEIIKNWRSCEMPYTCPHGRPISKIISHKQIASFFERNE